MSPGSRPIHGTRSKNTSTSPRTAITTPSTTSARPSSAIGVIVSLLKEGPLAGGDGWRLLAEVHVSLARDPAAARLARNEADLQQIWLDDLGQRLGVVVDGGRDRLDADRTPTVDLEDGTEEAAVEPVQAARVDALAVERVPGDRLGDGAVAAHLGVVAHAPQQAVDDPGRAARAPGDLPRPRRVDARLEDGRRAGHDAGQLRLRVEVEVVEDAEPLPQRRRQHAGSGGGRDQGERPQRVLERARVHALVDDE